MTQGSTAKPGRVYQITATSNPRIKTIRSLAMKKAREKSETFLAEGFKLIRDAFENGWKIETLIFNAALSEPREIVLKLAAQARTHGADVLEVNEKVLATISRKDNPQQVIGVMRQQWHLPPQNICDPACTWLALDRVRDPGNLGTIIRTADAVGAQGIILVGDTADPYSKEASRASMGSIFNVPLVKLGQDAFIRWRENWQGQVVGTHLAGAQDFRTVDYAAKSVLLLMGNEQQGLSDDLASLCDDLVYIPMNGAADSLNLAIATGVMLFHMGKRLPPPGGPA